MPKRGFSVQKSPKGRNCPVIRDVVRVAKRTTKGVWIAAGVAVAVVLAALVYGAVRRGGELPRPAPSDNGGQVNATCPARHPWTGECVDAAPSPLPRVAAVMVENAADAWPLSGLNKAFLAIEAPAEADIPRFVAFFSEDADVNEIGPVRSARLYYLSYAAPFRALYAHVGGSPEALDNIRRGTFSQITDFDEYFHGSSFRRDSRRAAPHNVYTSMVNLRAGMDAKNLEPLSVSPMAFGDAPKNGGEAAREVIVDWTQGTTYDVVWRYNETSKMYERLNAAKRAIALRDGSTIAANNVLILRATISTYDEVGRKRILTLGTGKGIFVRDGKAWKGMWSRKSENDFWTLTTEEGERFVLAPGKTWVEIVDDIGDATITGLNATETTP